MTRPEGLYRDGRRPNTSSGRAAHDLRAIPGNVGDDHLNLSRGRRSDSEPFTLKTARPTSRVGIVGIGGLGHMAVKFAAAFGYDVTAFTSSEGKFDEARGFGANHVVSSRDPGAIKKLAGTLDLLLVTVNVPLDWDALVATLAPTGRLHVVGLVLEPIPVHIVPFIMGQLSLSGSPTGSPMGTRSMLDFAAWNGITPQTEHYPMSRINEAFERLEAGKARYRIVLDADF